MFAGIKEWVARLIELVKAWLGAMRQRFGVLDHGIKTFERYNEQQGNVFAAGLTYRTVLALVPVLMVAFAVAGFFLASRPELITSMQEAIVDAVPGALGEQLNNIMNSAIASRTAVGVIGLLAAAFTGIGWMSGLRTALTQMWGGQVERNAVMSTVYDLAMFIMLGLAFLLTIGISALANGSLLRTLLSWVGLADEGWVPGAIQIITYVVAVGASTLLYAFILARVPLVNLPFQRALAVGFVTAVIFEVVKKLAGVYFKAVLSSPAGVAFGPIIGVMVLAYLAARILLYASAWCATATSNVEFQVANGDEADGPLPPVQLSPVYDVHPVPDARTVLAGVGVGAVVGYLARGRRRG